jgi:hypothetical protein
MPVSIDYAEDRRAQEIATDSIAYATRSLEQAQERALEVVTRERNGTHD